MTPLHTLVLGGQKSGKSRHAEQCAADWLRAAPGHRALLLATAEAGDAEMAARIARHQVDRAARVPGLATLDVPQQHGGDLARAIRLHSAPSQLLVVDCLTLWLTQLLMPLQGPAPDDGLLQPRLDGLLQALEAAPGPVLWVSNEIGLGISPLGREVRRFVDVLGGLHQRLAARCQRVQLLVAGCVLDVKHEGRAA
ncbi:MAG: bifunctional adenosylcobinamide kinase/adenosylcobinamide-phosphate guanylyltransferase [Burkholderiaceae bacterium]|nr:bifunctional adenosylcobinamide kinase/adenosylcobinamide-phosphate guanylyltransferase [Burkholderiaceae bacterium]